MVVVVVVVENNLVGGVVVVVEDGSRCDCDVRSSCGTVLVKALLQRGKTNKREKRKTDVGIMVD